MATPKRNQKPNLKAEAAYENAHLVAQDLVARIGELLFDLPAPGNDEHPIHWGHVGRHQRGQPPTLADHRLS